MSIVGHDRSVMYLRCDMCIVKLLLLLPCASSNACTVCTVCTGADGARSARLLLIGDKKQTTTTARRVTIHEADRMRTVSGTWEVQSAPQRVHQLRFRIGVCTGEFFDGFCRRRVCVVSARVRLPTPPSHVPPTHHCQPLAPPPPPPPPPPQPFLTFAFPTHTTAASTCSSG